MPVPPPNFIVQFYNEVQAIFAILFGMVVQFIFVENKSFRMVMLIIVSSVFVALYLVPSLIDLITLITKHKIEHDSKFAITLYALSSLLSMEILAFIMKIMPKAARVKMAIFLGVDNDKFEQ